MIDDADVISSLKVWSESEDLILRTLCKHLIERKLFKTKITKDPINQSLVSSVEERIKSTFGVSDNELHYFLQHHKLVNSAYTENYQQITILQRDGKLKELGQASDNLNILALATPVEKYCLCHVALD